MPGRVGMIAGLFFGVAFGISGIGAAALGALADRTDIFFVYRLCSYLPAIGVLALWLPRVDPATPHHEQFSAMMPELGPAGE
jgi:FSR family fosmidomycin resistance protein-like MFS transporter